MVVVVMVRSMVMSNSLMCLVVNNVVQQVPDTIEVVSSSSSSSSDHQQSQSSTHHHHHPSHLQQQSSRLPSSSTTNTTAPPLSTSSTTTQPRELLDIQSSLEQLNRQSAAKVLEIERQFNALRQPLYDRRAQAIADGADPHFWFKAFCGHHTLRALLDDSDRDAFQYLRALSVRDLSDGRAGFRIAMQFDANPHFANAELSKEFAYADDGPSARLQYARAGQVCRWRPRSALGRARQAQARRLRVLLRLVLA
jgi:hypothetical protein